MKAKAKKPRNTIGLFLDYHWGEWVVIHGRSGRLWSGGSKKIRRIGEWFLKAADWIEAQEKKE